MVLKWSLLEPQCDVDLILFRVILCSLLVMYKENHLIHFVEPYEYNFLSKIPLSMVSNAFRTSINATPLNIPLSLLLSHVLVMSKGKVLHEWFGLKPDWHLLERLNWNLQQGYGFSIIWYTIEHAQICDSLFCISQNWTCPIQFSPIEIYLFYLFILSIRIFYTG